MRRTIPAAMLLLLAACAAGDDAESTATVAPAAAVVTTVTPTTTTAAPTTTTAPPPTTTTLSPEEVAAARYEADVALIQELWRSSSDSWLTSIEAGFDFAAAHNYPPGECTTDDLRAAAGDIAEDHFEEIIVDADTIERHDGWVIPVGPREGEVPKGRVYIFSAQDSRPWGTRTVEIHTTIWMGEAYFFLDC